MAKLKLDPKKMEVVKKTVSISAPTGGINLSESDKARGMKFLKNATTDKSAKAAATSPMGQKTKGGVPTNPTDAAKFFDSEIARHEGLLKKINKSEIAASTAAEQESYNKQYKETFGRLLFLEKQKEALKDKMRDKDYAEKSKAYSDSLKNRPIMEKVKEKLQNKGSVYMLG